MSLYLEHFHLRELPFRLTPAVEFFYRGCVRGETLEALKYAIANGEGIISVVGEVGTGKSMLCRVLMDELRDEVELVYIANPSFSDLEIIYHIAEELALDISGNQHQVARDLQSHLLSLHQQGKKVLVCIDEAQAMPDNSLEQIRLLSNLETSTDKIVQIVLFGQPELDDKLGQQHLRQLRERITSSFTLRNLDTNEIKEYINHRLIKAGNPAVADEDAQIFTAGAVKQIAKVSQGISRRINILCDKAMLAAFADNSQVVAASHAQQAARDARYRRMNYDPDEGGGGGDAAAPLRGGQHGKMMLAAGAVLLAVGAVAYQVADTGGPATSVEPAPVAAAPEPARPAIQPAPTPPPRVPSRPVGEVQPAVQPAPPPVTVAATPPRTPEPFPAADGALQPAPPPRQDAPVAALDNPRWSVYPPGSYLRQRLNATQTQFSVQGEAESYTARILTASRGSAIAIERYLRDLARFFSIRNVMVYPSVAEGAEVFVITYGLYPSEFQAELFIHELPSFFRDDRPYTQALAVSQLEAAAHW